jgi:hypothetical protein
MAIGLLFVLFVQVLPAVRNWYWSPPKVKTDEGVMPLEAWRLLTPGDSTG